MDIGTFKGLIGIFGFVLVLFFALLVEAIFKHHKISISQKLDQIKFYFFSLRQYIEETYFRFLKK